LIEERDYTDPESLYQFLWLVVWRLPPWLVVVATAAGGAAIAFLS
jgi:hypothetical protein